MVEDAQQEALTDMPGQDGHDTGPHLVALPKTPPSDVTAFTPQPHHVDPVSSPWPLTAEDVEQDSTSLKQRAIEWQAASKTNRQTTAFNRDTLKSCCRQRGACYAEWKQRKWPWWKRRLFLQNLNRFISRSPVMQRFSALPRPQALAVFLFKGVCQGEVSLYRVFMLGHYNLSPLLRIMIEYTSVSPKTLLPCRLLPICKPFVKARVPAGTALNSKHGCLKWQTDSDIANELPLHESAVPINDETSRWYVARLPYSWSCLTDPKAPASAITIASIPT